jgi:hypothetical protein
MRQNRMMRRGERRDHLNLQVDLLAEKEITKVIQMVRAICGHMGLQDIMADTEIRDLSQNTSLARTLLLSRLVRHWRIGCREPKRATQRPVSTARVRISQQKSAPRQCKTSTEAHLRRLGAARTLPQSEGDDPQSGIPDHRNARSTPDGFHGRTRYAPSSLWNRRDSRRAKHPGIFRKSL